MLKQIASPTLEFLMLLVLSVWLAHEPFSHTHVGIVPIPMDGWMCGERERVCVIDTLP